ncbi:RNA-binding protein 43-like [Osmerus mordax]|uniref:RNA-binding protein 43-like n=1 Tax=Osmerus mordax TaxID=8014 RepID=UPI003510540C
MDVVDEIRTVVVAGVPDILPSDRMADKLVIHFQSLRSNGGDVQNVLYPTISKGVAFVTFDNIADAERVIKKEQSMRDEEFPKDYTLTVFKFTTDVFFYVSTEVNLSGFSGPEALIQSLRSAHRSVRICTLQQNRVTMEGPFTAVKALREDLIGKLRTNSCPSRMEQGALPRPDNTLSSIAGCSQPQRSESRCNDEDKEELEEDSVWVDSCMLMYIQKFNQEELARCLREHNVSARFEQGTDLTAVHLRGLIPGSSGVQGATLELNALVSIRQSTLRVHVLNCTRHDLRERQRLLQLCEEASVIYKDILYVPLDSCIKVVGPSTASYLFYEEVILNHV